MPLLALLLCLLVTTPADSEKATDKSFPVPAGWRTEHIDFPLPFAPELEYKGWEELRFAPGMFDDKSETYFTYAFLLRLDGRIEFNRKSLAQLLTTYFQGLCRHVAEGDKPAIDVTGVVATIDSPGKKEKQGVSYRCVLKMIDVFVTKKPLDLNLDILVSANGEDGCTCIMVGASPKAHGHDSWKELDQLRADFHCPCGDTTDGPPKKE